jgi:hypothetical protein
LDFTDRAEAGLDVAKVVSTLVSSSVAVAGGGVGFVVEAVVEGGRGVIRGLGGGGEGAGDREELGGGGEAGSAGTGGPGMAAGAAAFLKRLNIFVWTLDHVPLSSSGFFVGSDGGGGGGGSLMGA